MSSSNSNSRKRNWFITVNKGADCYEDFENLLSKFCINGKSDYAMIQHTPEATERTSRTKPFIINYLQSFS